MMKLGMTVALGVGILVASQAFELTTTEAHARLECVASSHAARGPSRKDKGRAENGAINSWEREARKRYGMRFNQWGMSRNRNSDCKSNGRETSCVVSAVACAKAPLRNRIGQPSISGANTN